MTECRFSCIIRGDESTKPKENNKNHIKKTFICMEMKNKTIMWMRLNKNSSESLLMSVCVCVCVCK